ncbi:hypothetical protein EOD42_25455 [Rhodovarius crocodyli]|uniref:Uncharacterized protein n=1 Tax=Rhodovarius crocodyli TaxID=1979269 RepID=A0A437LV95_9PROT|nr:hypothetical protein [Rhodovarius crocodyli]RVT89292.1 hypothetical protein EOD42_25455 [Rhodovarius crocodyli]
MITFESEDLSDLKSVVPDLPKGTDSPYTVQCRFDVDVEGYSIRDLIDRPYFTLLDDRSPERLTWISTMALGLFGERVKIGIMRHRPDGDRGTLVPAVFAADAAASAVTRLMIGWNLRQMRRSKTPEEALAYADRQLRRWVSREDWNDDIPGKKARAAMSTTQLAVLKQKRDVVTEDPFFLSDEWKDSTVMEWVRKSQEEEGWT